MKPRHLLYVVQFTICYSIAYRSSVINSNSPKNDLILMYYSNFPQAARGLGPYGKFHILAP
jgi:hypothetical protein